MNKQKFAVLAFALGIAVMVAGCQPGPESGADSVDALKARAEQRWTYLIDKKADQAYEFLTPGYRKAKTLDQYVAEKSSVALKWKSAKATRADCEEDVCTVFVTLYYEVTLPNTGSQPIDTFAPMREKWMKVGKQWYFLPDK